MKGLNLFLAACFIAPTIGGAVADTVKSTTRTPTARTQNTTTTTRKTAVKPRNTNTASARTTVAPQKNVVKRAATVDKSRSAPQPVTKRENSVTARTAKKSNLISRFATKVQNSALSNHGPIKSRAATTTTTPTRDTVMQRDFGKCKTVFFECMDEFCANKDTQLKRCACSSRSNEFKSTQKSLDNIENKLLDFSQRLLKVNMDPDDAAVINVASAGETAYYETKDKTASKKTLDEIAKKLNANFDSAESATGLSALTWSLDPDAAFDSVDSLSGISTTAKSGVALRNAALPICREMAAEVCDDADISLVENSYNMAIEQDCNTVKRAYETQTQAARTKVLESSALLDMTRLNNYQENNSDDILTCKSKMLDMLTNTNVCGENLTKCLDVSGQYINPTTGEAFLSANLVQLSNLIVRPTGTDSWAKTPKNAPFVSYLNTKKKYIEPATKNCQSLTDTVWNDFINDALAQIKLAQNAKLEEVRTSCTTLMSECISGAKENLSEFDSRALSTFGVITDKTVNGLCDKIKTSCSAVMEYTPDAAPVADDIKWETGVTNIQASETYNTIINTCREVGRNCIINSCKSITGNFGLCENIMTSVNRHSILNRRACWDDVMNCVAQASDESINNIKSILPNYNVPSDLYTTMYATTNVFDICAGNQGALGDNFPCRNSANPHQDPDTVACYRCRIAEQIWGNCEKIPDAIDDNKILIPTENRSTLMSWFAKNTHTDNASNSCKVSLCPAGQTEFTINNSTQCYKPEQVLSCSITNEETQKTTTTNYLCLNKITTPLNNNQNCCELGVTDSWGNCCASGNTTTVNILDRLSSNLLTELQDQNVCAPDSSSQTLTLVATYETNDAANITTYIMCWGSISEYSGNNESGLTCSGQYIIMDIYKSTDTNNNTTTSHRYANVSCDTNACSYNYNVNYFINANVPNNLATGDTTDYCSTLQNINSTDNSPICTMNKENGWVCTNATPTEWTNADHKNWTIKF